MIWPLPINGTGYKRVFDFIRIVDGFGDQDSVEIDGNFYPYKFVNNHVKTAG
ncbi:MAG: hypothetical protein CM1200mP10_26340 [Candidatus Neomarinimicrobiota bacterium]|nr:MAG: hypothetical protein CM1200mP10_26340 [Candidatus Neomarinimicrobiota bacterium]